MVRVPAWNVSVSQKWYTQGVGGEGAKFPVQLGNASRQSPLLPRSPERMPPPGRVLNTDENAYIVPGLGDAGDRLFGTPAKE